LDGKWTLEPKTSTVRENYMKSLKFKHEFAKEILDGRKTTTWWLFDDKDLTIGDKLELVDRDSKEKFGEAIITDIKEKKIKDLTEEELKNHGYADRQDMINSHKEYYDDRVNLETEVKMLTFDILKT